jgi:hypothetical protein
VFAQAWGMQRGTLTGQANLCRWHVLGSELDFEGSLEVGVELGAAGSIASTAFLYLSQ